MLLLQKAVDLTDNQRGDTLFLRQALRRKQGQLARERKALLSKMAGNSVESMDHVSDKVSELTHWSEQLRINATAELHADVEFGVALYCGVCTVPLSLKCIPCLLHSPGYACCWSCDACMFRV